MTCASCAVAQADAQAEKDPAPGVKRYPVHAGQIDHVHVMNEVSAEREAFRQSQQRLKEAASV